MRDKWCLCTAIGDKWVFFVLPWGQMGLVHCLGGKWGLCTVIVDKWGFLYCHRGQIGLVHCCGGQMEFMCCHGREKARKENKGSFCTWEPKVIFFLLFHHILFLPCYLLIIVTCNFIIFNSLKTLSLIFLNGILFIKQCIR